MTTKNDCLSFLSIIILLWLFLFAYQYPEQVQIAVWTFDSLCRSLHYPVENHTIITQDKYILTFFRLQAKNTAIVKNKEVVYLQHGLVCSADDFIVNDEYNALAFKLANKGYDVWVANSRGNQYSKLHEYYNPEHDMSYWQFTFQHMASYDLPDSFEYIVNITGQSKINFIGHSQGATIMLAALAEQNQYIVDHIKKFVALGPVVNAWKHRSNFLKYFERIITSDMLEGQKSFEVLGAHWLSNALAGFTCQQLSGTCQELMLQVADDSHENYNSDRFVTIFSHYPAGTSLLNLKHWLQISQTSRFQKFDYGKEFNIKKYKQVSPPLYNLSQITIPVNMIVGTEDKLASLNDTQLLFTQLNNSVNKTFSVYNLGHSTFLWGKNLSYIDEIFLHLKQQQF